MTTTAKADTSCASATARVLDWLKGKRCTGHCCRMFPLPYDLETIQQKQTVLQDGAFIADMLVPLPREPELGGRPPQLYWWFTCRHLTDRGDCGVYEERPEMCRGYPYGGRCVNPGCTASPGSGEPHATISVDVDEINRLAIAVGAEPYVQEPLELEPGEPVLLRG